MSSVPLNCSQYRAIGGLIRFPLTTSRTKTLIFGDFCVFSTFIIFHELKYPQNPHLIIILMIPRGSTTCSISTTDHFLTITRQNNILAFDCNITSPSLTISTFLPFLAIIFELYENSNEISYILIKIYIILHTFFLSLIMVNSSRLDKKYLKILIAFKISLECLYWSIFGAVSTHSYQNAVCYSFKDLIVIRIK